MSPAGVSGGAGGGAEARGGGAEEEPVSHVRTVGRVAAVGSRAFEGREAWCGNGRCFYGMGVGRGQTGRPEAEETAATRRRNRGRGGGFLINSFVGDRGLITVIAIVCGRKLR